MYIHIRFSSMCAYVCVRVCLCRYELRLAKEDLAAMKHKLTLAATSSAGQLKHTHTHTHIHTEGHVFSVDL